MSKENLVTIAVPTRINFYHPDEIQRMRDELMQHDMQIACITQLHHKYAMAEDRVRTYMQNGTSCYDLEQYLMR